MKKITFGVLIIALTSLVYAGEPEAPMMAPTGSYGPILLLHLPRWAEMLLFLHLMARCCVKAAMAGPVWSAIRARHPRVGGPVPMTPCRSVPTRWV